MKLTDLALSLFPRNPTAETRHLLHIAAERQRLARAYLYVARENVISAMTDTFGPAAAKKAAKPLFWEEECRVYWTLELATVFHISNSRRRYAGDGLNHQ